MILLGLMLAESGGHDSKKLHQQWLHLASHFTKNPLMIAIISGIAISSPGLKLPAPVAKPFQMLAIASSATALFAVGGALAGLKIKVTLGDISRIVFCKLILHPLAVILALLLC